MKKICSVFFVFFFMANVRGVIEKNPHHLCEQLVHKAVQFMESHPIDVSCHQFQSNSRWMPEGIFVIVMDYEHGNIFTFGSEREKIGTIPSKHFVEIQSLLSPQSLPDMQHAAENKSWTTYAANFSYLRLYCGIAVSEGRKFIVAAGYYPQSDSSRCKDMINQAIQVMKAHDLETTFQLISDPNGIFVNGGIYLWVMDQNGLIRAHGNDQSLIGRNIFEAVHLPSQVVINLKNFINSSQEELQFSTDIFSFNRHIHEKKYFDPHTQMTFIIGAGYYSDVRDTSVIEHVVKAKQFLRLKGIENAANEFNKPNSTWASGERGIFIYTLQGICLVDSLHPDFIGKNQFDRVDRHGRYYVRHIIHQATQRSKAWVTHEEKRALRAQYAELIVFPDGETYVVGSGYWVTNKEEVIKDMVSRASEYLTFHGINKATQKFSTYNPDFLYGDISISVFDDQGMCLAYGPYHKDLIWGILTQKDFLRASSGPLKVKTKNGLYQTYITHVPISNQKYTVVAGYYVH